MLAVCIPRPLYWPNTAAISRIVEFVVTETTISSAAAMRDPWKSPEVRERVCRKSWIS